MRLAERITVAFLLALALDVLAADRPGIDAPVGAASSSLLLECAGRWIFAPSFEIDFGKAGDIAEGERSVLVYRTTAGRDSGVSGLVDIAGTTFGERPTAKALKGDGGSEFAIGFSSADGVRLFTMPQDNFARSWEPMLQKKDSTSIPSHVRSFVELVLTRYSTRVPGTIPTTPGICTPYGFFADPPAATERDYVFDMRFRDPKHSNLILGISIKTRNELTTGATITAKNIRDEITPWDFEREHARRERKDCRSQQGTASHDIFGRCAFAGLTVVRKHRPVEYLRLANGQEARLLVMEYAVALNEYVAYDVLIETAGVENSATEPRIVISARGIDAGTAIPALRGKKPPPLDVAVKYARDLALSLRPRPGAVDPTRPVKDSLAEFR